MFYISSNIFITIHFPVRPQYDDNLRNLHKSQLLSPFDLFPDDFDDGLFPDLKHRTFPPLEPPTFPPGTHDEFTLPPTQNNSGFNYLYLLLVLIPGIAGIIIIALCRYYDHPCTRLTLYVKVKEDNNPNHGNQSRSSNCRTDQTQNSSYPRTDFNPPPLGNPPDYSTAVMGDGQIHTQVNPAVTSINNMQNLPP